MPVDVKKSLTDRAIDFVFSKDPRKWVLVLFLVGLILRALSAIKTPFNADEMVHGTHAIGFISSGKLQIMDQDAIWFFLTDLFSKLFNTSMLGIRFLSVFFGALTIIMVYLVAKEIFEKKTAIISAILLTFSSFALRETRAEMDLSMTFFVLFAVYSLIIFYKSNQSRFFYLSWISLGIAVMVKQIAITVIPAFVIFHLYHSKKIYGKMDFKKILIAALILILMVTPILTFNYLLYKDKKILDLQFARFTKISFDTYESLAPTIQPFSAKNLLLQYTGENFPGFIVGLIRTAREATALSVILFVLGMILLYKNKSPYKWLVFLSFLFPYLFLSGTSLLPSHLAYLTPFIALFSAYTIVYLSRFFKDEKTQKYALYSLVFLVILFNIINIYQSDTNGLFGSNEVQKFLEYKNQKMDKNSLVIFDSRIYRGQAVFMLWDTHYLEAVHLPQALEQLGQTNLASVNTFFVECTLTDCGWGTIKDQPDLNKSMEEMAAFFKEGATEKYSIKDNNGNIYFTVYKKQISVNPQIIALADSTHEWFYYPVNYKPSSKIFDNYTIYSPIDGLLDGFAHYLLYFEVFISLLIVILVFFVLYKDY